MAVRVERLRDGNEPKSDQNTRQDFRTANPHAVTAVASLSALACMTASLPFAFLCSGAPPVPRQSVAKNCTKEIAVIASDMLRQARCWCTLVAAPVQAAHSTAMPGARRYADCEEQCAWCTPL